MANAPIVILTGAGISAESGVQTFRGDGGLWEGHRVEDVATPEGFARNPALVHEFYNGRRRKLQDGIEPNAAHLALARLEAEYPGEVYLITQNIDNLHERAGSRRVWHMHGELLKARCTWCHEVHRWECDLKLDTPCPGCGELGWMRPHVVWFGEMPFYLEEIAGVLAEAAYFLSVGTSGRVYPAAGFAQQARMAGARTVEVNLEETEISPVFVESHRGPAGEVLPPLVDAILAGGA